MPWDAPFSNKTLLNFAAQDRNNPAPHSDETFPAEIPYQISGRVKPESEASLGAFPVTDSHAGSHHVDLKSEACRA
jgi:hypothetical protein